MLNAAHVVLQVAIAYHILVSSPRAWGCFYLKLYSAELKTVFPTRVGVFPVIPRLSQSPTSLPHARGGVSLTTRDGHPAILSSPRAWGCFFVDRILPSLVVVFPTRVGVFPSDIPLGWAACSLPHARGGVSQTALVKTACRLSSPRAWGCFSCSITQPLLAVVFPTRVGVFLLVRRQPLIRSSLPHARGGVSWSL